MFQPAAPAINPYLDMLFKAIMAGATTLTAWFVFRGESNKRTDKENQRLRDEAAQKREEEKAEATRLRDEALAAGTAEVARKAAEVAKATIAVKDHLEENDTRTADSLSCIQQTADKVHTIVNSQKTAMMEELKTSRSLTLGMANALLRLDPKNEDLKKAVIAAQTLYDKSVIDTNTKEQE